MRTYYLIVTLFFLAPLLHAGRPYWQQQANYTIQVELNSSQNKITGTESIEYFNNSPKPLSRLFFHIYWNSIKSGGQAAQWMKTNGDFLTDKKFLSLKANEEGSQRMTNVRVNGQPVTIVEYESIVEVLLNEPIAPDSKALIELSFEAQVPFAVRRGGRDSPAGIEYSMCQWYPKICRYDASGWHADPYIGREFAGTFGNFDVKITADKKYTIAGTGVLQNKQYADKGYKETDGSVSKDKQTVWHFIAESVHDFAWAADPKYDHVEKKIDDIVFHFFYRKDYQASWQPVINGIDAAYAVAKENFGAYPYPQFSFIQAGEGYMEYPMCTFLEGKREDFTNTAFHEFMHAWFYGIFGTDENMYHWMDEGMTCYADIRLYHAVVPQAGNLNSEAISTYNYYRRYTQEEPATTFANHFKTSEAYVLAAYYKGWLFIEQLRYIIGEENVKMGFHKYYDEWKFRHPEPNDFVEIMEDVSGIELTWFQNYWLGTVKTIDYAVEPTVVKGNKVTIGLKRIGQLPMPVDVRVTFDNGTTVLYYIPLDLMYGAKPHEREVYPEDRVVLAPWSFAVNKYEFEVPSNPVRVVIDPLAYMAETELRNNKSGI